MGGKSSPPPPPDYSGLIAMSEKNAQLMYQLGQDQLAWAKEQYAQDRALTNRVVDQHLQTMQQNNEFALKDRQRYEDVFQPLEDDLARDAMDYSSQERKEFEMGQAKAGVSQAFDAQRDNAMRRLESYGINPSSTRFAALDIGTRTAEAAAAAAAGTMASDKVDAIGRALRSEAVNVGRGYPGQVAGTYGTALQAGNQAVNSNLATTASGAQSMGTPAQFFGAGNQAMGIWGNALTDQGRLALDYWKADQSQSSGIGALLGMLGGAAMSPFKPFWMANKGGAIPEAASPSGGKAIDDVPARLTAGEFVIPEDAVRWHGEKALHKLIESARQGKQQAIAVTGAAPQPVPAQAIPVR